MKKRIENEMGTLGPCKGPVEVYTAYTSNGQVDGK